MRRGTTIEPARRLEQRVPSMALKGRLHPGANGDIVLFDAAHIIDRATFREPTLPPVKLRHVIVNGAIVVRDGAMQQGIMPGRAVRAPVK